MVFFFFIGLIVLGNIFSVANWGGRSVNWIDGLVRLLCRIVHRMPATQIPLPKTGGAIVVANHVSGLDPFLLIAASHRPLRFLIAREIYQRRPLHGLFKKSGCIPVDRSGKPEAALRQALRALQAGEVIAIFPHGKIHLDTDPPRKLKGGVARLAAWSGVPVFPVRIDGVSGEGKVALAPIIPSHVQLTVTEPFICEQDGMAECLEKISAIIENKISSEKA
ncbi:MAG: 1-acyl-sn-glycerol-3-phosphate acyltransferase [Methylophaga sp.]|nr:MAG: 1-acyl-sn-glycerol-3-phosphate acyltransferase [Methylophaga sp.]